VASKNLGAVIQRAISDGAFRRQLQSDPAAALRGFNLTPTEIAAIRSGDPGKLMSLGVDQRVSKAYSISGGFLGGTRSAISDMGTGATSNAIIGDPSATRDVLTTGNLSGTRAVNDPPPFEGNVNTVSDPTLGGTRAINDTPPTDLSTAATTGDLSGTRAVLDTPSYDSGTAVSTGDLSGTRAIVDNPPFEGNANQVASGDPYSGQYVGVSPDFQARLGQVDAAGGTRAVHDTPPFGTTGTSAVEDPNAPEFRAAVPGGDLSGTRAVQDTPPFDSGVNTVATGGVSGPGDAQIAADDNYSVSSRMADAGDATSIRSVQDVEPFDSGIANAAAPTSEFIGGDIQQDPGDVTKTFVPSDSADVQREMLDGTTDGGALGNTGGAGHPS
jgi:hypothetical protein